MSYPEDIAQEELAKLDQAAFAGAIVVVTKADRIFSKAMEYLGSQRVIGFDTETRPVFHSGEPKRQVALLQLSGKDRAYLFRLNSLGIPGKLTALLSRPEIIKVGAAVHDDIKGLQSYRKFVPEGFVDLQSMVGSYGLKVKSVKKMAAIILGLRVSKAQQLSNWEAPELTEAQLEYAATDAWVCREMYIKLKTQDNI